MNTNIQSQKADKPTTIHLTQIKPGITKEERGRLAKKLANVLWADSANRFPTNQ